VVVVAGHENEASGLPWWRTAFDELAPYALFRLTMGFYAYVQSQLARCRVAASIALPVEYSRDQSEGSERLSRR
jgi:hypothetical protein